MAGFRQKHGNTAAAVAMVAFVSFIGAAIALESDDTTTARTTGGVVFGLCAVALLTGMWLLREGRATAVADTLIVVGSLVPGVGFFWMLLLPTALAFVVIYFGVIRGGLARELRLSSSPP